MSLQNCFRNRIHIGLFLLLPKVGTHSTDKNDYHERKEGNYEVEIRCRNRIVHTSPFCQFDNSFGFSQAGFYGSVHSGIMSGFRFEVTEGLTREIWSVYYLK